MWEWRSGMGEFDLCFWEEESDMKWIYLELGGGFGFGRKGG